MWSAGRVLLVVQVAAAMALAHDRRALAQEPKPALVFGQEPKTTTPAAKPGMSREPGVTQPQELRQSDPGFLVRADVDRGMRSYRGGDALTITAAAEVDAYLYVLYKQADGQVFLVFPNSTRLDNRVHARQTVAIPGSDDLFRWVVGPPFGKETIKVLASKEPLTQLSDPAMRAKFFNPVSGATLKGIRLELGKQARNWAEDTIEINTYAATAGQTPAGARRFGLFVGVGQHQHIARTEETADGKRVTVYQPNHRDARMLAGTLEEVGRLSQMRIVTNDEATRANVEQAVTEWLPSVSRPGDTTLLYFSGMALPISQAAGVQAEGIVLPLYDFMTANTVQELRKKRTEGKISSSLGQQLRAAEQLMRRAGAESDGAVAVVRQWGITEDLLAHWLQALAGRQVILILDTPYASAFGPQAGASANPGAGGLSRLEGLGQRDLVLLGACGEQLSDVLRNPQGLSLMTELLIQSIRSAAGSLSVDEAHRLIGARMETRLEEVNQRLRAAGKPPVAYRPYLTNTCSRPALLKP
jgi:hypothetical protein